MQFDRRRVTRTDEEGKHEGSRIYIPDTFIFILATTYLQPTRIEPTIRMQYGPLTPLIALSTRLSEQMTADMLSSSLCTCASPSSYLSSSPSLLRSPPSNMHNTHTISDSCGTSTSYSQDSTYLRAYKATKNGHSFVHHRELFGPDQYEVDGSGGRDGPVAQAREGRDVGKHCDGICSQLDGTAVMRGRCGGKACKVQVCGAT